MRTAAQRDQARARTSWKSRESMVEACGGDRRACARVSTPGGRRRPAALLVNGPEGVRGLGQLPSVAQIPPLRRPFGQGWAIEITRESGSGLASALGADVTRRSVAPATPLGGIGVIEPDQSLIWVLGVERYLNRVPCRWSAIRGCAPLVSLRKGRPIPVTGRSAVEREFGRLKNEYGLTPLRTRGLDRVRLHADLTTIARLGQAVSRARWFACRVN
jgi:hypothetical protein